MAISCAGEVFKETPPTALVDRIYFVLNNTNEDNITRGAAYESLAILYGLDITEIPQPLHFDIQTDVVPEVIEYAKEVINQQS